MSKNSRHPLGTDFSGVMHMLANEMDKSADGGIEYIQVVIEDEHGNLYKIKDVKLDDQLGIICIEFDHANEDIGINA